MAPPPRRRRGLLFPLLFCLAGVENGAVGFHAPLQRLRQVHPGGRNGDSGTRCHSYNLYGDASSQGRRRRSVGPLWSSFKDAMPSDPTSTMYDQPSARTARFADLKRRLFAAAAGLNRGIQGTVEERQAVMRIVDELNANTPDSSPCSKFAARQSRIAGTWKLVFTNAADVLLLGVAPGLELGTIRQTISDDARSIINTIDLMPPLPLFPRLLGSSVTELRITLEGRVASGTRIMRTLRGIQFRPQSLVGVPLGALPPLRLLLPFFAQRTGHFDTTFVDDDLWIIRSASGDIYVSTREP